MEAKKIIVVGAGPAGMMAAIRAADLSQEVTLVEKKPTPGNKLLLSGKGRCNLTNACDLDSFLRRFSRNGQFLRDAFGKFFNLQLIDFFEKRNLKLKTERQLRVFPDSDNSASILEVLKKELQKKKVKVLYKAALKDIFIQDKKVKGITLADGKIMPLDRLILATGGVSYSFTGSSGEALDIVSRLGHHIVALRPGLVPLEVRGLELKLLEGLVLHNVSLKFSDGKKQITSEIGELLFTGFGISGPLVLTLSGQIVDWLSEGKHLWVEIDLKPALSMEQLNSRLLREFKASSRKNIKNTLTTLLPKNMISIFIARIGLAADKKVSQITQEERRKMVAMLKSFRLDIKGSRPLEEAMITRGGISLKEINPRTMESRLIKGLYFCGEMIDIDADTGGFNLQAAFSTGYLAGESAALS
ncbi:MAG: NAD(P)/FAD-dependent oxidoreductase [bacterium]